MYFSTIFIQTHTLLLFLGQMMKHTLLIFTFLMLWAATGCSTDPGLSISNDSSSEDSEGSSGKSSEANDRNSSNDDSSQETNSSGDTTPSSDESSEATAPDDPIEPMPYTVFEVRPFFVPSGMMGNTNTKIKEGDESEQEFTWEYEPGSAGWAGVKFLRSIGTESMWEWEFTHAIAYSLTEAKQLEFDAKSSSPGTFTIEGPSSKDKIKIDDLEDSYQHYVIELGSFESVEGGPFSVVSNDKNAASITIKNIKLTTDDSDFEYRYQDTYREPAKRSNATVHSESSHGGDWSVVWEDNFDGSKIDEDNWNIDLGNGIDGDGWGNWHYDYSTDAPETIFIKDGVLQIKAIDVTPGGSDSPMIQSVHMNTRHKQHFQFGKVSARIKMPTDGDGRTPPSSWPAFWMLGALCGNKDDDGKLIVWPECGEIDIIEGAGLKPEDAHGNLIHPYNTNPMGGKKSTGEELGEDFHVYGMEWDNMEIKIFIDDDIYATVDIDQLSAFKEEFYIIINSSFGGSPEKFTGLKADVPDRSFFPATMEVDWVRYETRD